jgi:two-component system sensor histidine kinase ChvG
LDAELALQELEPVDLRHVLRGVVGVFRDIHGSSRNPIVLEIVEEAHNPFAYVVQGHEARLGRVITNLLDNAISFSPQDGVITVKARRAGPEIEIVVEDEGPGIPPDKLEDVFKRFYSDRPQTDRTVGKNSGLGLSISREIVNAYGGHIRAANRPLPPGAPSSLPHDQAALRERRIPGVAGASFIVRLPAADAAALKGAPLLARRT